jgi:hypothetical protein
MDLFLRGAIAMGCVVAALLFFRFWKRSGDNFFLCFGLAFLIEGLNRSYFALSSGYNEDAAVYYLARLGSYALILGAVISKNLSRRR